MAETTKSMIKNFVHIVEKYGFIPNGGRVYYLRRSQPPLLTGMVYEYYEATHDMQFLLEVLPVLEKEMRWWERYRGVKVTVNGKDYTMYQYRTQSNVPRPESYKEDKKTTNHVEEMTQKRRIWRDLASAAESGWDFSSRWFGDGLTIETIETTQVVPVDLNAYVFAQLPIYICTHLRYMCWNLNILTYLFDEAGESFCRMKSLLTSLRR
jgi:alpha,alpha-trehalase